MKAIWGLVFLLIVGVVIAAETESADAENKAANRELNESDFWPTIDPKERWLLFFFADWCGHCNHFKPTWASMTTTMTAKGIKFAKLNAPNCQEISNAFDIRGYPTIIYAHNGRFIGYKGPREEAKILEWMDSNPENGDNSKVLPKAPSIFTRFVHQIYSKMMPLERYINTHVWQTVVAMFIAGILTGYMIALVTTPSPVPPPMRARSPTPQQQTPAEETKKTSQEPAAAPLAKETKKASQ